MDNIPFGADTENAPWNEKERKPDHVCVICGDHIYEEEQYFTVISTTNYDKYICEDCSNEIHNQVFDK